MYAGVLADLFDHGHMFRLVCWFVQGLRCVNHCIKVPYVAPLHLKEWDVTYHLFIDI